MALLSKRLAIFQHLQSAANNQPVIKFGETGPAVQALQLAFISLNFPMPRSTRQYSREPDGIFGSETFATVKAFQAQHALAMDGIVGRQTMSMLDKLFSAAVRSDLPCANCLDRAGPFHPPGLIQAALGASSATGAGQAKVPTKVRHLTSAEETKATSVFGSSLVFSTIVITNALGLNGRAFVTVMPTPPGFPTLTVVNWGDAPSEGTFFHELAHVWQSQHHIQASAFMVNALASQGAAEVVGGSAYAFIPGRMFFRYGAEQTAQQVQRGKTDIINHMRSFPPGVPDPTNLPVPALPFWETRGAPGVET